MDVPPASVDVVIVYIPRHALEGTTNGKLKLFERPAFKVNSGVVNITVFDFEQDRPNGPVRVIFSEMLSALAAHDCTVTLTVALPPAATDCGLIPSNTLWQAEPPVTWTANDVDAELPAL